MNFPSFIKYAYPLIFIYSIKKLKYKYFYMFDLFIFCLFTIMLCLIHIEGLIVASYLFSIRYIFNRFFDFFQINKSFIFKYRVHPSIQL
jgi:hypothetical protein